MKPRATTFLSAVAAFIIVILVAAPEARQQPAFAGSAAPAARPADKPTDIDLLVGRSTILNVGSTITRVSLTVPDIADAMVTTPTQLLIHGKQPGTISLFVWDRAGAITAFEVNVRRDLSALVEQMKQLFPGEPVTVAGSGKDVILSGVVSSKYVIEKSADVASGYVEKKENVVNLLKQQEGVASNQVMLRVRFAEVSRNALQEVGASLFSDGYKNRFARTTTQQFAAPVFDENQPSAALGKTLVFSDYLNLFLFDAKNQLGAVVKALQTKGVFQSLAEPNLIALNGKEASFLAGGEFPYPVPQGNFGSFTIQFKEYGVRLSFTPTVLGGDLINLKIAPEVSSLDFNNAVIISGFRIPALTSRRASTEIEIRDGQTFAIAGLLNNTALSSMHKVPGLGDIPVLGLLFRSRAYQKDQTELVVMVTPQIVRRDSTGVSEGLPALAEPFLPVPTSRIPAPAPYIGSPRTAPAPPKGGAPAPSSVEGPAPQPDAPVSAPAPAPVTRPIQEAATLPRVPAPVTRVEQPVTPPPSPTPTPRAVQPAVPDPAPAVQPAPEPPKPTKAELKALEQQRKAEQKALEQQREAEQKAASAAAKRKAADDKRKAEAEKAAQQKADKDKRQADKLAQQRATREAEVARKNAEIARGKADQDQKREKALADAAARLKQAQAAYQAEIEKTKGIIK